MDRQKENLEMSHKGDVSSLVFNPEQKYTAVNKYSVFPAVHEEASKNLFRSYDEQKTCFLCRVKVSDSGIIDKKKHACMFCYNAVCQSCSPLKCNHPKTCREERVCMQCYYSAIEEKVKNDIKNSINPKFNDNKNYKTKYELENKLRDHQTEIQALDAHIENAREELERLEAIKNNIDDEKMKKLKDFEEKTRLEVDVLRTNMEQVERKIEVETKNLKEKEDEVVDLRKKLEERTKHFYRLEEELERLKYANETDTSTVDESLHVDKEHYIDELNRLKVIMAELQEEQKGLKKELSNLEKLNK